jgi:hypothetical protein
MRITIRAFNKDGYHKDLLIASETQVHMHDMKVTEPKESMYSGLIGYGGGINPKDFPEMVRFEVVISENWK